MNTSNEYDSSKLETSLNVVKKYRRKLHQIARLEALDRQLTSAELNKISLKEEIRSKLQEILDVLNANDDSFNSISSTEEPRLDIIKRSHSSEENNTDMKRNNTDLSYLDTSKCEEAQSAFLPPPSKKTLIEESTADGSDDLPEISPSKREIDSVSVTKLRKSWKKKTFEAKELIGHNGIVCALDISGNWLVTGSQDTSVKLWDITTTEELRNLPGHTGTVTSLKVLDKSDSNKIYKSFSLETTELNHVSLKSFKSERLLLSASIDCSIKIWLIPDGVQLKSIYTYSPVSCLFHLNFVVFVGTVSGKLTAFNLSSGQQIYDSLIHNDKITTLKWNGELLLSTSLDGNLKLWKVEDVHQNTTSDHNDEDLKLNLKYSLKENEKCQERPILSSSFYGTNIVFGDDGNSLKVLDITEDAITKYPNHIQGSGFSDSLVVFNDLLLSASYNPINGTGSINVRIPDEHGALSYVASLCHDDLPRIFCTAVDKSSQSQFLATGGEKVFIWKKKSAPNDLNYSLEGNQLFIKGCYLADLSKTDVSSDIESADTEEEDATASWWWSGKPSDKTTKQNESRRNSSSSSISSDSNTNTKSSSWWCALV